MATVVKTYEEYYNVLKQSKTKTVVFYTQASCGSCKPIEEQLLHNNFALKYPDLKFYVVFLNTINYQIEQIKGTPTTRIYQNGQQIGTELLGGTLYDFENLVSSHSAYKPAKISNNSNNNNYYYANNPNNYYYPYQ